VGKGKEVRWAELPSPRLYVPIITVRPGRSLVCCVAGRPLGVFAHYLDGRSHPCLAVDARECPHCKKQRSRWKGFLPVEIQSGARRIVEITEVCQLKWPYQNPQESMGRWIEIQRLGPNPNSPLRALPLDYRDRNPEIRPFDAKSSVEHMWGLDQESAVMERHQNEG